MNKATHRRGFGRSVSLGATMETIDDHEIYHQGRVTQRKPDRIRWGTGVSWDRGSTKPKASLVPFEPPVRKLRPVTRPALL